VRRLGVSDGPEPAGDPSDVVVLAALVQDLHARRQAALPTVVASVAKATGEAPQQAVWIQKATVRKAC
jgi:hypothetical protein